MAVIIGENLGLGREWDLGETYKNDMDDNLKLLDGVINLNIIDRDLTDPPGSPATGDRYIPAATATGTWAGHEDDIAIFTIASQWRFITPKSGWLAVIEDEDVLCRFNGSIWTSGIAF